MKKLFFITIFLCFTSISFAQELKVNEIDDFTNERVKITSWKTITMNMQFTAYFKIAKINDNIFFHLKLIFGSRVFSIKEDQELMFKLENGDVISLFNPKFIISCRGCGSIDINGSGMQGVHIAFPMPYQKSVMLEDNVIEKFRIYTSKGYIENWLKPKNDKKIKKALALVE